MAQIPVKQLQTEYVTGPATINAEERLYLLDLAGDTTIVLPQDVQEPMMILFQVIRTTLRQPNPYSFGINGQPRTINGEVNFTSDIGTDIQEFPHPAYLIYTGGDDWTFIRPQTHWKFLYDTSDTYENSAGFVPSVNATEDSLQLVPPATLSAGYQYQYDQATAGSPAVGFLQQSSVAPNQTDFLFINNRTTNDILIQPLLTAYVPGDVFEIRSQDNPNRWRIFRVTAPVTNDNLVTTVPVSLIVAGAPLDQDERVVLNTRNQGNAFTELIDTPDDYEQRQRFVPRVAADISGLEFQRPAALVEGYTFNAAIAAGDPGAGSVNFTSTNWPITMNISTTTSDGVNVKGVHDAYAVETEPLVIEVRSVNDSSRYRILKGGPLLTPLDTHSTLAGATSIAQGAALVDGEDVLVKIRTTATGNSFIEATDTPSTYRNNARRVLAVTADETGTEFIDPSEIPRGSPFTLQASTAIAFPGTGHIRFNDANLAVATQCAKADADRFGFPDFQLATISIGDTFFVWDEDIGGAISYEVTSVDRFGTNLADGWVRLDLANPAVTGTVPSAVTNVRVEAIAGGAGTVPTTFLQLLDTPANYTNAGNQMVGVNATATALQFYNDVVRNARTITAGRGLTGGGNLSANRTIDFAIGSLGSSAAPAAGWQFAMNTGGTNTAHNRVTLQSIADWLNGTSADVWQARTGANSITNLGANVRVLSLTNSTEVHRISPVWAGRVLHVVTPNNNWFRRDRGGTGQFTGMNGDYRNSRATMILSGISNASWTVSYTT